MMCYYLNVHFQGKRVTGPTNALGFVDIIYCIAFRDMFRPVMWPSWWWWLLCNKIIPIKSIALEHIKLCVSFFWPSSDWRIFISNEHLANFSWNSHRNALTSSWFTVVGSKRKLKRLDIIIKYKTLNFRFRSKNILQLWTSRKYGPTEWGQSDIPRVFVGLLQH